MSPRPPQPGLVALASPLVPSLAAPFLSGGSECFFIFKQRNPLFQSKPYETPLYKTGNRILI